MENKKQQITNKEKPHWTYYLLDTTNCYVKTITNTSKAGNNYNSYYFYKGYKLEEKENVIFKFSTPVWNCFVIWDGENRYMIVRVDKSDTNESVIKMVQQLESMRAHQWVKKFSGSGVFDWLSDEDDD